MIVITDFLYKGICEFIKYISPPLSDAYESVMLAFPLSQRLYF